MTQFFVNISQSSCSIFYDKINRNHGTQLIRKLAKFLVPVRKIHLRSHHHRHQHNLKWFWLRHLLTRLRSTSTIRLNFSFTERRKENRKVFLKKKNYFNEVSDAERDSRCHFIETMIFYAMSLRHTQIEEEKKLNWDFFLVFFEMNFSVKTFSPKMFTFNRMRVMLSEQLFTIERFDWINKVLDCNNNNVATQQMKLFNVQ